MLIHEHRAAVDVSGGARGGGGGLDWTAKNWLDRSSGGCYSHDSEPDLAALVSDFLESSSAGAESWLSSDGDSGYYDLADKILVSVSLDIATVHIILWLLCMPGQYKEKFGELQIKRMKKLIIINPMDSCMLICW